MKEPRPFWTYVRVSGLGHLRNPSLRQFSIWLTLGNRVASTGELRIWISEPQNNIALALLLAINGVVFTVVAIRKILLCN